MKMRSEADISALLTVQWGFEIIFKQWMTLLASIPGAW